MLRIHGASFLVVKREGEGEVLHLHRGVIALYLLTCLQEPSYEIERQWFGGECVDDDVFFFPRDGIADRGHGRSFSSSASSSDADAAVAAAITIVTKNERGADGGGAGPGDTRPRSAGKATAARNQGYQGAGAQCDVHQSRKRHGSQGHGQAPRGTSNSRTASASAWSLGAIKEATFGMGCFWEPAESFLKEDGVLASSVGYAGAPPGTKPPTYDTVCFGNDYVEAVRVVYDDAVVSYDELLDAFCRLQKPGPSRQYNSVVFVNDDEERSRAVEWKEGGDGNKDKEIVLVEPMGDFYRAEEYHQEYWVKQRVRAAAGLVLIAGSSGAFSDVLPETLVAGITAESAFNGLFLIGAAWMLLERVVAADVRMLAPGELAKSATR